MLRRDGIDNAEPNAHPTLKQWSYETGRPAHYPLQAPRLGRAQQRQAILERFGKRDSWGSECQT